MAQIKTDDTYESNFRRAQYTAIISDLHLCEEEPIHPKFPLWKKYKTREFFFDDEFAAFLKWIEKKAQGSPVELILNGDIFDFDSVASLPDSPPYRLTRLERARGLHPQEQKSIFKIERILAHHETWVSALREFLLSGHRVVVIIGNHDLELHFPGVQQAIRSRLNLPKEAQARLRFNEWFYISNSDTLVEHGNQYDPYCMAQDPVNPYILKFNRVEIRVPFGNLATRYLINGMGFFNPHADTNYIMTLGEYVKFFFRYMLRAQPLLMVDWLWGSIVTLTQSFFDRLHPSIRDPLTLEDRIQNIADKANATPRMVRELQELFVAPAASYPLIIARELWLDRAFLVLASFLVLFQLALFMKTVQGVSLFWIFIPLFLFLPFFVFYSRSVSSLIVESKEPREDLMVMAGRITQVNRVVYGHTHIIRHEMIGPIEHLNSGTWSPAFTDVECTERHGLKSFVWIEPKGHAHRQARLLAFENLREVEPFIDRRRVSRPKKRTA